MSPAPPPAERAPEPDDAVRLAWRRALAAARDRGLRPGSPAGSGLSRRPGSRYRQVPAPTEGSGAGPSARDPQPLADLAHRVVKEAGWDGSVAVGGVIGRWREVVGDSVADHCRPTGFGDGVLTVRAETTAWATQLRMLSGDLQRRLNEVVGAGVVDRIEVLAPDAPSWRRGRWTVQGRGARDTYG